MERPCRLRKIDGPDPDIDRRSDVPRRNRHVHAPSQPMKNFKLVIAYFGQSFSGWQKTNAGTSVEEALEKALHQILQHEVRLQAASRTDAGVHAERQVVNFFTPKTVCLKTLLRGL